MSTLAASTTVPDAAAARAARSPRRASAAFLRRLRLQFSDELHERDAGPGAPAESRVPVARGLARELPGGRLSRRHVRPGPGRRRGALPEVLRRRDRRAPLVLLPRARDERRDVVDDLGGDVPGFPVLLRSAPALAGREEMVELRIRLESDVSPSPESLPPAKEVVHRDLVIPFALQDEDWPVEGTGSVDGKLGPEVQPVGTRGAEDRSRDRIRTARVEIRQRVRLSL